MNFEDEHAALHEWHFFREFTYSKTKFRPIPSTELELADSVIWIGDLLVIYQLKERVVQGNTTAEVEKRWFEKKVLGTATRQIRDTLAYLDSSEAIQVQNHRGHSFALTTGSADVSQKLVVYLPNEALPNVCRSHKYHRSRTAGLIHVIPANDYLGIVRTLLTPAEVSDYLAFREELIEKWEPTMADTPEAALVGQYLTGDISVPPSVDFIDHLKRLEHQASEWDMSGIISMFPERIITDNEETDYYPIVRELALMKRNELREFKERFELAIEKARANEFAIPYQMACPRTNCGFVFVPLTIDAIPHRMNSLRNFSLANKYDLKLPKCIGVTIADDVDGWFTAEWMYAEFPWEYEAEMEGWLADNYPFRKVREVEMNRYSFREEK